jgi:hypothetical protein
MRIHWLRFAAFAEDDIEAFKKLKDAPWEMLSRLNDEQVKALARAQAPATNIKLNFKRYSLPFLDAHLSALNLFSVNSRYSLTEFADSH